MIDFTSSLYLGMKHSSAELKGWQQLTAGVPAALCEHDLSKEVGKCVANMQGLEEGISAASTLHLYWDLFGLLSRQQLVLFMDDKVYPVSKYGIEKLAVSNIPVYTYKHQDADHLSSLIKAKLPKRKRPVVLCDGWCPLCGKHSPVNEFAKIIKPLQGIVVVDDTQAFGILGAGKTKAMPYGAGGGGILKWLNVRDPGIVTITSLAKAFGVPMAVICGDKTFIESFETNSITRVNSSPVSMAHLHAAANAFSQNDEKGKQLRSMVWRNVSLLRTGLSNSGIKLQGGIFPVQSINELNTQKAVHLFKKLKSEKIKTVLIKQHEEQEPALSFIIRCDHTEQDIKQLSFCIQEFYCSFSKIYSLYGNRIRRNIS